MMMRRIVIPAKAGIQIASSPEWPLAQREDTGFWVKPGMTIKTKGLLRQWTSEHKKKHSFQEQENGKEGSLETQARFDSSPPTPEFAKSPMIYEVCLSCNYRENANWNQ